MTYRRSDESLPMVSDAFLLAPNGLRADIGMSDEDGLITGDYRLAFTRPAGMTSDMGYIASYSLTYVKGKSEGNEMYGTNDWFDPSGRNSANVVIEAWDAPNVESDGDVITVMSFDGMQMPADCVAIKVNLHVIVVDESEMTHGMRYEEIYAATIARRAKVTTPVLRFLNGVNFEFNHEYDGDVTFNVVSMSYQDNEWLASPKIGMLDAGGIARTSSTMPKAPTGKQKASRYVVRIDDLTGHGAADALGEISVAPEVVAYLKTDMGARTYFPQNGNVGGYGKYTYNLSDITDAGPSVSIVNDGYLGVYVRRSIPNSNVTSVSASVSYMKGTERVELVPYYEKTNVDAIGMTGNLYYASYIAPLNVDLIIDVETVENGNTVSYSTSIRQIGTGGMFMLSPVGSYVAYCTIFANTNFTRSRDISSTIRYCFGMSKPTVSFSGNTMKTLVLEGDLMREMGTVLYDDSKSTDAAWEALSDKYERFLLRTPAGEMFTVALNSLDLEYDKCDIVHMTANFTEVA